MSTEDEISEDFRDKMTKEFRETLIAQGIPVENADELLEMAQEFGKRADEAVREFENRGGKVIFDELLATAPPVFGDWDQLTPEDQEPFVRAFASCVDYIDDELYDTDIGR